MSQKARNTSIPAQLGAFARSALGMPSTAVVEHLYQLKAEYGLLRAEIDLARITGDFPSSERIVELVNRSSALRSEIDNLKKQVDGAELNHSAHERGSPSGLYPLDRIIRT